jgi:ribosomal protein S18 acetylase RimI-like enzyme
LLDQQFRAQAADYVRNYPAGGHRIVELEGDPIGRVWLDRRPDELLVVDMAILPEHRSSGIGSLLLREIFADADAAGVRVRMTTSKTNPRAIALCKRLGFSVVDPDEVFVSLVRSPTARS